MLAQVVRRNSTFVVHIFHFSYFCYCSFVDIDIDHRHLSLNLTILLAQNPGIIGVGSVF